MDVGSITPFSPQNFDRPGLGQGSSSSSLGSADKNFSKVLDNKKDSFSSNQSQSAVQSKVGASDKNNGRADTVDSIPRRVALQSFLRKMREELGVDASEVVDALSSLSQQELAQHPIANLTKILDKLQLSGAQREKAELFFLDFLKQTSTQSFADYLKSSDREISMEVLSQRELRERQLKDSLALLNQNFFAPPQPNPTQDSSETESGAIAEGSGNSGSGSGLGAFGLGLLGASAAAGSQSVSSAPNAGSNDTVMTSSQGLELPEGFEAVKPQGTQLASQNLKGEAVLGAESTVMAEPPVATPSLEEQLQGFKLDTSFSKSVASKNAQAAYDIPKMNVASAEVASLGAAGAGPSNGTLLSSAITGASTGMLAMGDDQDSSGEEASADTLMQDAFVNPALNAKGLKTDSLNQQFTISMPQATPQQESANIDEIIRQAEMLSTKGGGEMKISLTPEGMGEVAMKVSVQDGRVNVEMIADSGEAKSLLEKGIGELKSSLASHKLNVEQIKVDFQGDISKQFDDQRQQADRQMAQQFLEDFRQQNNGWRRGFYDIPGMDPTRRLDGDPAEKRIVSQPRSAKAAASRRLDLVA